MKLLIAEGSVEDSSGEPVACSPPAEPIDTLRLFQTNRYQRTESAITITKRTLPEPFTRNRPVSPQESPSTIIVLDTSGPSDKDESDVSQLSEDRLSAISLSSVALHRFFPKLPSNDFAVESPMRVDADTNQQAMPIGFPLMFETELHERVHTLYESSAGAVESPVIDVGRALEQKTASSSGSGSEDVFDCASSCYSRRSSITSVKTESFSPATEELNKYTILPISCCPLLQPALAPPPRRPWVQDPVDRAIAHMVNELGFNVDDVK
jgi:hypothetical protein